MDKRTRLKAWVIVTRPHFLLCAVVFILTGFSLAVFELFKIKILDLALTILSALLAQIRVNALDDYHDYKSGIDIKGNRTTYSGGTGILVSGSLTPSHVYYFGLTCLVEVLAIGAYFAATAGIQLIPIGLIGIMLVLFYTTHLAKIGLGELACGLGFMFLSIGTYFVQTTKYDANILLVSSISAHLMWNILLLNEFPDIEADKFGGRRNIPIRLGLRKSSVIFSTTIVLIYIYLVSLVVANYLPIHTLISLLTLPLATRITRGVLNDFNNGKIRNYLPMEFMFTIIFPVLLSLGLIIASV